MLMPEETGRASKSTFDWTSFKRAMFSARFTRSSKVTPLDTALPVVDQKVVDYIFQALGAMEVDLDENPLEFGPRRLNYKVAEVRRMLTDMESLYLQISGYIQKYKSAHRAANASLEMSKKHLMANDPEVRAGRNLATQDALASVKLREDVERVSRMVSVLEDLDAMMTVIKSKRADLKDIQTRIKDQINLCREEVALGGKWGSKPPPGTIAPDLNKTPKADSRSLRDLQNLFSEVSVDGESLAFSLEDSTEEESISQEEGRKSISELLGGGGTSQEELDGFLQAVETEVVKKPKVDIDAILGDDFKI